MTDLNASIRERLDRMAEDSPVGRHDSAVRALLAVLDLAGDMCGDDDLHDTNAHACGGRGEPDCALCAVQSIQFAIARELGIKEKP